MIPHNNKNSSISTKPNKGFTLAEVLITLGIVGVIAALTLPNLITEHQKDVTVNNLKKVYSEITQAIKLAEAEHGSIEGWNFDQSNKQFYDEYLTKYIATTGETTVGEIKSTYNIKYIRLSGVEENVFAPLANAASVINLPSGMQLFLSNVIPSAPDLPTKSLLVDINGYKNPNKMGKDLFYFRIYKKKGLVPSYEDDGKFYTEYNREKTLNGPSSYSYQCNKAGRGVWCGALIIYDGWKISDDYPWQ